MNFEPKIIGFLCTWCSYAGADLAGVSRIQYPPNIRIIRVMCSGRVEPYFVFEVLLKGIDGIIIMGCHPGECHYLSGNLEAQIKIDFVQKLLSKVQMENRIQLEWVSASEGLRFGKVVNEFTEHIRSLGPSPLRERSAHQDLFENMTILQKISDDYRLRALIGRQRNIINEGNVYNVKIEDSQFQTLLNEAILDEYLRQKILHFLKKSPASVNQLADLLQLESSKVLAYIVELRKKGLVDLARIKGLTPIYTLIQEV